MRYEITKRLEFDAGHRVPLHASKCRTPHGHRYAAEITCGADVLTTEGFVVDFGKIKEIVGQWIDDNWDHTCIIQEDDELMIALSKAADAAGLRRFYRLPYAPTAENMAHYLFEKVEELLAGTGVVVLEVAIWETPTSVARWR